MTENGEHAQSLTLRAPLLSNDSLSFLPTQVVPNLKRLDMQHSPDAEE
jgi:hypothetical protein